MTAAHSPQAGKVFLVGAGPGDPGLMTVRGLTVLRQAQVVIYDRLVHPVLLAEAPPTAERIDVGKALGRHTLPQADINALLIQHAARGRQVVRLKGGDPFVFGRGGEECQALAAAGIAFEIVPGVSSAIAGPAYAGIPVTHRAYASSFTVVTGHTCDEAQRPLAWRVLAQAETLIILMGLHQLAYIVNQLIVHGRAATTPVAVIHWGTTAQQVVVTGTLADIGDKARALQSPATIVVGQVVALGQEMQWFHPAAALPSTATLTTSPQAASVEATPVLLGMLTS